MSRQEISVLLIINSLNISDSFNSVCQLRVDYIIHSCVKLQIYLDGLSWWTKIYKEGKLLLMFQPDLWVKMSNFVCYIWSTCFLYSYCGLYVGHLHHRWLKRRMWVLGRCSPLQFRRLRCFGRSLSRDSGQSVWLWIMEAGVSAVGQDLGRDE